MRYALSTVIIFLTIVFANCASAQAIEKCAQTKTPCWPTASRPVASPGVFGYNKTTAAMESWNGTEWALNETLLRLSGRMTIQNSINYSAATNGEATSWIYQKTPSLLSGVVSGPDPSGRDTGPFSFFISDIADAKTNTPTGLITHFGILSSIGTGAQGPRQALEGRYQIVSPITYLGGDVTSSYDYVGVAALGSASVNLGGSGGACCVPNWRGNIFGSNSNVFTAAGATNMLLVAGTEIDTTLVAGSSTAQKIGVLVQLGGTDRGTFDDVAMEFGTLGGTATWKYGISFGGYANSWPFSTDSTLIYAQPRTVGAPGVLNAKYGVDFSNVVFQATNSAPLRMPLATPANSAEACDIGAMRWDANFIYVCTALNTWKRATLNAF